MEFIQNKGNHTLCIELLKNNNLSEFKEKIKTINVSDHDDELLLLSLFEKKQAFIEELLLLKKETQSLYYFDQYKFIEKILKKDDVELVKLIELYINTENYEYVQMYYLLVGSIKQNCNQIFNYLIKNDNYLKLDYYHLYSLFFDLLKFKQLEGALYLYDNHIVKNINLNENDTLWNHKSDFIEIIDIYTIDEIQIIFNKLQNKIEYNEAFYIDLYLDLYQVKNIDVSKFHFILNNINDEINDDDITKLMYEICVADNTKLFKIVQEHYNYSEESIITNLKNNRYYSLNRRNYKQKFISEFGNEISFYFFNLLKNEFINEDVDQFIHLCIDKNKINILNELKLKELPLNKNKLKSHLLEIVETKHIDVDTLKIIFEELSCLKDIKFIIEYFNEYLVQHNNKIYFLYEYIKNQFNEKEQTKIFNKIRLKLGHHIGKLMYENSDDHDWIFINHLNQEITELKAFQLIKKSSCIDLNDLYELSFVYWIQKNKYFDIIDDTIFHEKITEYHYRFNKLSPYIIKNLEYDKIMELNIELMLKSEEKRMPFLKELYEFNIQSILKVENINQEIANIFKEIYKNNTILGELFIFCIKRMEKEKVNHVLQHLNKKFKIKPIKTLVKNIVYEDNFYLLKRVYDELNKQKTNSDLNKFNMELIKESIHENNTIILHWVCNYFKDEELKQSVFDKFLTSNNTEIDSIHFYLSMFQYLNDKNRFQNIKNILFLMNHHYNKNYVLDEIIDKHIDYSNYEEIKYIYLSFIDFYDINYLKKINSKIEEHKQQLIEDINIEYHFMYSYNVDKLYFLHENGFNKLDKDKFKLSLNELLENKLFFKKISLYSELNFIDYLKTFKLFNEDILDNLLDSNLLTKLLKKLKKLNLDFSNIHDFIKKYDVEIDLQFLISISETGSVELFKYFYDKTKEVDLSAENEELFFNVCVNGHLELAKYLLEIKHDINIQIDNDSIFCGCCNRGQLKVIKWLYSIIPELSPIAKNEHAICGACYGGYLHVAKWLMKNIEGIDIKVDNDYCMIHAVDHEDFDLVDWICELEPERYKIVYNSNNTEIEEFTINKKLIIEKSKEFNKEDIIECPICYENISSIITCCDHQFCFNCLDEYNKKSSVLSCAYCRKEAIELFHIIPTES